MVKFLESKWTIALLSMLIVVIYAKLVLTSFDMSDESYVFLISKYPDLFFNRLHMVGFLNHELFKFLRFSISLFRVVGVLFQLITSFFMFRALFTFIKSKSSLSVIRNENKLAFIYSFATLFYCISGTITLSYNLLNVICIQLSVLYLIYALIHHKGWKNVLFIFLCAVSTSLLLLSKSTTLILIIFFQSIFFFIYPASNYRKRLFKVAFFLLICFLSITIITIITDGGIFSFLHQWKYTLHAKNLMETNHNISFILLRILQDLVFWYGVPIIVLFVFSILAYKKAFYRKKIKYYSKWVWFFLVLGFSVFFVLVCFILFTTEFINNGQYFSRYVDKGFKLLFSHLIVYTVFSIYFVCIPNIVSNIKESKYLLVLALFTFILPFSCAIGTNNSYAYNTGFSCVFFFITIIILLYNYSGLSKSYLNVIASAVLLIVCLANFNLLKNPYRGDGTNYFSKKTYTTINNHSGLYLSEKEHDFIEQIKFLKSHYSGEKKNFYALNYTEEVGISIPLEVKFIKTPWFFGGYKGANKYAKFLLENEDETRLKNAWVIMYEKNIDNYLDATEILNSVPFINFPEDYTLLKTISNPYQLAQRGINKNIHRNIQVWKPSPKKDD